MTGERKKHFSMLRSFSLADLFTFGNASCGTASIFVCLNHLAENREFPLWPVYVLLALALFFDFFDGSVARWRKKQSPLGADLDSLADIVSFGVAPAVLGFTLGLRGGWDAVVLVYFVACGISRLARYNVTAASLSDESGKVKYYEGTPIPTSLVIVLLLFIANQTGRIDEQIWFGSYRLGPFLFHPFSLIYALSGTAMVSATLRIPKP